MSSRLASKPGVGIQESVGGMDESVDGSVEQPEESVPGMPDTAQIYEPAKRERRKGHHVISTATYYQTERRRSESYGQGEAQDWPEADSETDHGL